MVRRIPFFVLSEHRIQDGQQLAHTGNQRHFFGFSCCNQPHVKRFYHWIEAGCYECSHVKRAPHSRPTTKNGSSASHGARVPIDWCYSHESANFSSREPTQLRNLCQQCGHGHSADALNATQPLRKLFEGLVEAPVAHKRAFNPRGNRAAYTSPNPIVVILTNFQDTRGNATVQLPPRCPAGRSRHKPLTSTTVLPPGDD